MADLRAALRLLLLVCGTVVLWFAAWIISLAPATRADRRRPLFRTWARFAARVINLRCEVDGALADGPGLVVANHLSYVDVVTLAALRDTTFVAKAEVARWPILGPLCRFVGTLFIKRGRSGEAVAAALAQIEDALAQGRLVVVFPEGTSSDGRQVLPFRPALLEAARLTDRPIGWAALSYFTPPGYPAAEHAVCWWGDMTLVDHLYRLVQLPEIRAHVTFGTAPADWASDRKQLALRLQEAVVAARQDHVRDAHEAETEVRPVAVQ